MQHRNQPFGILCLGTGIHQKILKKCRNISNSHRTTELQDIALRKQVLGRTYLRKIFKLLKSNTTISYLQKHFIKIKYQKVTTILELFFNAIIYKYILDYSNLKDRSTGFLPSKMRKKSFKLFSKIWIKTNPLDCFQKINKQSLPYNLGY